MNVKTISERIREGLKMRHMKQIELAARTGIDKGAISSYVSGRYEPKQQKIFKIAEALNVKEQWLMGYDVSPYREPEKPKPRDSGSDATKSADFASVPLIDGIAAGSPIIAQENIVDYYPATVRHPDEYFALYVRGDSMTGAGIPDGSRVLIHMQNYAENGQIVACRVNGNEATLKRFRQAGSTVILFPENPVYEPIIVPASEFDNGNAEILGVLKQAIIDFE